MRFAVALKQTLQRQYDFAFACAAGTAHKHAQLRWPRRVSSVNAMQLSREDIGDEDEGGGLLGVQLELFCNRRRRHVAQWSENRRTRRGRLRRPLSSFVVVIFEVLQQFRFLLLAMYG